MPTVLPPAYPVINRSPSVAAIVGNFGLSDIGLIVSPTLFAGAFGFWSGARARALVAGAPRCVRGQAKVARLTPSPCAARTPSRAGKPIRRPQMMLCAHLGFLAGALAAYQCSSARLMGYRANPNECARFGLEFPTKEQIPPQVWSVVDEKWFRKA